ncbi:sulfite exporter TauE/SafE family protein [bacterium]|nr:sulfite exporter TauE/SafE family protein [bacterium]
MPFDTNIIISLGVVFFISQIIYSVAGFGSGMFAISILSLLYGKPDFFVPLLVLACIPTELYVTLKSFKNLSFKDNLPIYLGSFPALIAGTFFLKNTNSSFLLFLMGFILLLSCMASFYRSKSNNKKKIPGLPSFIIGLFSGLLGGLFGMAGPPLIIYFQFLNMNKTEFRNSLLSIFLVMSIMRVTIYSWESLITFNTFIWMLYILPFSITGLIIGNKLHKKIEEDLFKKLVTALLLILSISLIVKSYPF